MPFPPFCSLFGALLVCALLTGCESKKAPATAETSASTVEPPQLPDTATMHAPVADTAVAAAEPLPSGDVASFHEAFETRKEVAPGLVIVEKSVQQPATAIIHDPWDIKETFSIVLNGRIIYRDTATGMTYDFSAQPEIRKLYPMWIPTGQMGGELLVAFNKPPSKELARRYFIQNHQIVRIDTILTFDGPAKDWDHDGKQEFKGALAYSELWDDEQGKRWTTYDPTLYFEIRPTGLVMDSALTKQKIKEEYGVFMGFNPSEKSGVLLSKIPRGSRRHE
ncbi:hypothetical protein MON38_18225 [Hymenobacter sp. DH14]|uniref:DUF4412 domain-containing protein n=1 Tax=Hymenobacter cyanobacteriorum TaxID=2926463 RepID=A0A9X1VLS0_9BACT|nr:hypothetical protein [Hymenobacter cyanobacteriorum]MCI1189365.1 hypothetical protein [Hymenobacter cyanobacteriorum]